MEGESQSEDQTKLLSQKLDNQVQMIKKKIKFNEIRTGRRSQSS